MPHDSGQQIRFGLFEIDLAAGELRKSGRTVRLQDQPFRILRCLLKRPGEVVTREQLRKEIWGDDVSVDFDRSLNTSVARLREALGDSPTGAIYLETVPRKGYRFIAPIQTGDSSGHERGAGNQVDGEPPARRMLRPALAAVAALAVLGWWSARRPGVEPTTSWSDLRRVTADFGLTIEPTISRDGELIAYASDRAGNGDLDIWVQRTDGGTPIRITDDPANDVNPHFSPDGETVVFQSSRGGGGIYIAPSFGGYARLLAQGGARPRFSPNGEWVAYMSGNSVLAVPTRGGDSRRLSPEGVDANDPVWSPGGDSVLALTWVGPFNEPSFAWRVFGLDGEDRGPTGAYAEIRRHLPVQAFGTALRRRSPHYWDRDGWVAFSATDADGVDLWRIRIDPQSGLVDGLPSRILVGPGQFTTAAVADSGRIVVANEASDADIWSIAIDTNQAEPLDAEARRLIRAPGADIFPSISVDGSLVSFQSDRSGRPEQWVLSVANGTTRAVAPIFGHSILSKSGERIAAGGAESLTIVTLEGLIEQTLPEPGGFPWHFSPDESLVLYNRLEDRTRGIWTWDRTSDETAELIAEPDTSYFQGQFSPDGRWVAWQSLPFGIEAAPFRGLQGVADSERFRLSPEGWPADKPRWSPNGNVMYFVSRQDGYDCIYAQPLDPDSKQPRGEIVEIYHSHESSISIRNVTPGRSEISVARDKIVFGMEERTGNIWVIDPLR